jgi:UDP-N-acetylglucosamine 2-epimerase (non-hydrolysing)
MKAYEALGLEANGYAVATIHRPSNVDSQETLGCVLEALAAIARDIPVVLPMHPRTRNAVERFQLQALCASLRVVEPLGYVAMLSLMDGAALALTDSGGIQEETTVLGVPCVTLRESTERPVTVTEGTNRLAPWPLTTEGVVAAAAQARAQGRLAVGARCPEGWDGKAAERMAARLMREPADAASRATAEPSARHQKLA